MRLTEIRGSWLGSASEVAQIQIAHLGEGLEARINNVWALRMPIMEGSQLSVQQSMFISEEALVLVVSV